MLSSNGAALQCGLYTVPYKHEEQRGAVQLLHALQCLLQKSNKNNVSGRCQGEFTGYFQNVFWVNNIYGCTYLHVVDVEILFNDGFGFLVQLFLAQGGFGLNRWWWSRSRHWLH